MGENIKLSRSQIIKLSILSVLIITTVISFGFIFQDRLDKLTQNQSLISGGIIALIIVVVLWIGIGKILREKKKTVKRKNEGI
ncbi:MAG: hypothetical protein ABIG60_01105 [Patescibacteria group bacterium]